MHDLSHFSLEQSFDLQASMSRLALAMGLKLAVGQRGFPLGLERAELVRYIARTLHFAATEPGLSESVRQLLGQMCRRWRREAACTWDEVYAAWPETQWRAYWLH